MTHLRRRLTSAVAAAAFLGGATVPAVVLAPAAAAHSVLVSIDPEDGSRLDAAPEQIVLTFNEEINQDFVTLAVTTEGDSANRVAGEPVVSGETVTARVDDLASGSYTVGYRVTSADGHVVTGSSVFTVVGGAESGAAAGGGTGTGGSEAGADGGSEAGADSQAFSEADSSSEADVADETSGEDTGVNPAIWVVGGLAIVLIGGAFVLLRRGN